MLPLALPLPLSTEITMQSLMKEASNYLNTGRYKLSYELYIEALLSAVKEFKQLEFVDQCMVDTDLSSVFGLAHTCLRNAKDISVKCSNHVYKSPPPIPPKPSRLSANLSAPPPLPLRPAELKRAKSKPEFAVKHIYSYSDDDLYNGEEEEEEEEEEQVVIVNSKLRKASTPSLKIVTSRPNLKRRSSTSNISSSAPSSPLSSVSNPLNAVKSFLSLPGSIAAHSDTIKKYPSFIDCRSETNDVFLLANSTIDPNILVTVQTSNSDSLSATNSNTYLPMIPQAPLVTVYQSFQRQLEEAKKNKSVHNKQHILDIQASLNRVRNIHMSATTVPTILQFHPVLIAYQLTLIDSTIFRNIPIDAILSHAPKTPHPAIVASTDFFNYLTRLIEHAVLLQQDASGRAQHINHWIKVACKCHELKNYQTLKAVISALGTPPIQRLKRSWQFIPKKSMNLLDELSELMSEASNYGKYRERIGLTLQQQEDEVKNRDPILPKSFRKNSFSEPTVPFLGIFIHDMTYLVAAHAKKKKPQHNSDWKLSNNNNKDKLERDTLQQDTRVCELLKLFKNLQRSPPYSPNITAACIKDLNKNRKRKLVPHALARTSSAIKKVPHPEDDADLSIEMQQCLVTQYLLTRSWVSEKTVDELSLVREPTKTVRSQSLTESLAAPLQQQPLPPLPPSSNSTSTQQVLRSSSGSITSVSTGSNNSRPLSLEDEDEMDKKSSFWLFGRKSIDHQMKSVEAYGTLHRSPRHFSFEELNGNKKAAGGIQKEGSLAIFRKDFWKYNQYKSEPSLNIAKKSVNPSPSTSSSTTTTTTSTMNEYRPLSNTSNLRHVLSSPHPLDYSSELSGFQWE